jgi:hypothetical protein
VLRPIASIYYIGDETCLIPVTSKNTELQMRERFTVFNRLSLWLFWSQTITLQVVNSFAGGGVLRESEERFRQLAANISEVFWMTEPTGNKSALCQPGLRASERLAKHADRTEFHCTRKLIAAAWAGAFGLRAHGPNRPSDAIKASQSAWISSSFSAKSDTVPPTSLRNSALYRPGG